jgi:hypothetical protein
VQQERRVNKVQLARLAVVDLLALLGLPVPPARPELRGKPVRPAHLGPPVSQEPLVSQECRESQEPPGLQVPEAPEVCQDRKASRVQQAWSARSGSPQRPSP